MRLFEWKRKKTLEEPQEHFSPPDTADWNSKFDGILGDNLVRLHFWPKYRNPYQDLFYGADTTRFQSMASPIEMALKDINHSPDRQVVFHIHWLNFLFRSPETNLVETEVAGFVQSVQRFCRKGGVLLWTVHNLREHDDVGGAIEPVLRAILANLATAVFVHGPTAKSAVEADFPQTKGKIHIIPHGSYIGVYSDSEPRAEMRRRLNLATTETAFVNIGQLREYKGLGLLCGAVEAVPDAKLILAGKLIAHQNPELLSVINAHSKTEFYPGWISNAQVQNYLNAADFFVLPYRDALTSGAAILSLSFGLPVIAPKIGAFEDVINDGQSGILYSADATDGLYEALLQASTMDQSTKAHLRFNAFKAASRMLWSDARWTLFNVISQARG